jgi:hypothetical protein
MPRSEEDAKKYPLCTKLAANHDNHGIVMDFVDWLNDKGYAIGEMERSEFITARRNPERLWLDYLEIDEEGLEQERRAMLEEQRKANEKPKMPNDIDCGCDGDCG